jgi:hypothetical protein
VCDLNHRIAISGFSNLYFFEQFVKMNMKEKQMQDAEIEFLIF